MVAGHLREKRGKFHIVLNYYDELGIRRTKWTSTGLSIKGNKKRAEALLMEARQNFVPGSQALTAEKADGEELLFSDLLLEWLEVAKTTVELVTYSSYSNMVKGVIYPYFQEKKIPLTKLQARDIQQFYTQELKRVKASTVIHYHAMIHNALKYAVKNDLIDSNPAAKVERPKMERYVGGYYDSQELSKLFEIAEGTKLSLPIIFGAFYGLRRSEIIGLKWDAIDFHNNSITIKHTVTACNIDGKHIVIAKDKTKTKSSFRTLPLVDQVKELLLETKAQQEENMRLCGRCYNTEYLDYICVNEIGELIRPNYITAAFKSLLERNCLRIIRFHDLRHSCASLLVANGVHIKKVQLWLGHSDYATTANIYSHLDNESKTESADMLTAQLMIGAPVSQQQQA